ncbi:acyl-CoA synthetase (AMP-forming)/AMP-acid ligase II [Nocardioides sp. BE266]|uniref:class I adenylate-forming enzyme family protein n=1 Tax=Nocardioides sp. BE266 TaxID=2817725 RepID=UPI0028593D60|nr:AMP-binding protein [Nocardioides sp. BE266]MDR7255069.1 acyl-CoA synthetase (AMP-forming)/AMP-acid ligase II [Nocardioides sp. BE266]
MNIAEVLARGAADAPTEIALDEPDLDRVTTYQELLNRCLLLGAGLAGQELRPGDRVGLLLDNSRSYVEAFFGSLAAGLIVVPLNTRLTADDFTYMINDAGCRAILTEPRFLPLLNADATSGRLVVDMSGQSSHMSADDLMRGQEPIAVVPREDVDIASLMYTSGTTSAPKSVMLSHGSWHSVMDTAQRLLPISRGTRVLHAAPLTHGAGFLMLPTIQNAGTNVVVSRFDPVATAGRIAAGEVDGLFLVPSMIRMLLDAGGPDWRPHERFAWLYYAGSPIDSETFFEAARVFDCRMLQSFAQMETPLFLSVLDAEGHRKALADPDSPWVRSAGKILPDREVRIEAPDGTAAATGVVGEIVARSPQMMTGYWNRSDETRAVIRDGWLHTGDLGYIDEEQRLFVVDRLKDMIVTGGSNVYAREVEDALADAPNVDQVAVVGLPHRIWGEEVAAFVVGTPGVEVDEAEVIAHCRANLASYKVPKRVIQVESFPRNAYGKVLKRELRTQFSRSVQPSHGT